MKKRILFIIIAFVLAFMGGFGFYIFQMKVFQPIGIFIAEDEIKKGEIIKEDDIKEITIYSGNNIDYITDSNLIVGKYAKYDLAEGDYFRLNKITDNPGIEIKYLQSLEQNETAIGIKTDLSKCVGGVVKPGDFVNVIAVKRNTNRASEAIAIAQHIQVLHIVNKQGNNIEANDSLTLTKTNYTSENLPDVVVLRVPSELEARFALYDEIILSLNPSEYKEYRPTKFEDALYNSPNYNTSSDGGEEQ